MRDFYYDADFPDNKVIFMCAFILSSLCTYTGLASNSDFINLKKS
jgi:hypothetical protein